MRVTTDNRAPTLPKRQEKQQAPTKPHPPSRQHSCSRNPQPHAGNRKQTGTPVSKNRQHPIPPPLRRPQPMGSRRPRSPRQQTHLPGLRNRTCLRLQPRQSRITPHRLRKPRRKIRPLQTPPRRQTRKNQRRRLNNQLTDFEFTAPTKESYTPTSPPPAKHSAPWDNP